MKYFIFIFALCLSTLVSEEHSHSLWDYHPLHIGANSLYIGEAVVEQRDGGDEGHIHFNKTSAFFFMLLPISATTYFFPRVEWTSFEMDWDKNPKFDEKRFYYTQFGLTCYTTSLDRWRWITRLDYNIDTEHFGKPGPYGLWTWLLWGSYEIHRKWHYHIGTIGYVGMEGHDVFPVLGFDFSPNKTWLFQAIFPMIISIQYEFAPWCKLAIKGRPLRERFRVGSSEKQPGSIFHYSTKGAELNLSFEKKMRFESEIFVGYNFGGTFYIKNQRGIDPLYTDVKGAPYIGANIDYAF